MNEVPLSLVKDDLSKCLRLTESEEIVITRHGKPAGVLVGFETEDRLVRLPPRKRSCVFATRIERARERASATEKGCGSRMSNAERSLATRFRGFNACGTADDHVNPTNQVILSPY